MTQLNVSPYAGLSVADAAILRKQELAAYRWNYVNGGYTWNGYALATDDASRGNIIGAFNRAQTNPAITESWKLLDGTWTPSLDATQVISMATAVSDFVSAAYANEKTISGQIDAAAGAASATVADIIAVDITLGWPANHN